MNRQILIVARLLDEIKQKTSDPVYYEKIELIESSVNNIINEGNNFHK